MLKLCKELAAIGITIIELLLSFRFAFKFLGWDEQAPFVEWVYSTTQILLGPFHLAFPTASVRGEQALEFTTLFALFAYAFIGYLLQEGLDILLKYQQRGSTPVTERSDTK